MDGSRLVDEQIVGDEAEPRREGGAALGGDERRMHVRAYNFWVGLLDGRSYPAVADLEARPPADFADHAVLLDFTGGTDNPAIALLGEALRRECGLAGPIGTIADVPGRSVLSRLTDHYLEILANRAPIGFEAEFVGQRGRPTLYRGILMPFSSDDATIDYVYGVINWKELAEPAEAAGLAAEVERAMQAPAAEQVEAGRPVEGVVEEGVALPAVTAGGLAGHLAAARGCVEAAEGAMLSSRGALYRALSLAYDFALLAEVRPAEYADLLVEAGIAVQPRAPMAAVVKLVFGARIEKGRPAELAAALSQARRLGVGPGGFAAHVGALPGGLRAMVTAERAARRPPSALPSHAEIARAALRKAPPRAWVDMDSDGDEFVLLLARRDEAGRLAVVAPVPEDGALLDRAIRRITR